MKRTNALLISGVLLATAVTPGCGHTAPEERKAKTIVIVDDDGGERVWLGVNITDVTSRLVKNEKLIVEEGAYVTDVNPDSPAERAGIQEGDVIVEFDGKKIQDADDLYRAVRKVDPGTEVQIRVARNNEQQSLKAVIERRPERTRRITVPSPPRVYVPPVPGPARYFHSGVYGMTLEELNKQLAEYFGVPGGRGVLVKHVKPGSGADKAGFKAGDVIIKVGGEEVADVKDIRRALRDFKEGEMAEFEVSRKGTSQKLSLKVEEEKIYGFRNGEWFHSTPEEWEFEFRENMDEFKNEMREFKIDLERDLDNARRTLKSTLKDIRIGLRV